MKKNNLSAYLFIFSALSLILFIGYKSNDTIKENDFSLTEKEVENSTSEIEPNEDNFSNDYTDTENNIIINNLDEKINSEKELISYDSESISINSIKIAQSIDTDPESKSYRDPIEYETITTVHEAVIKEIDYYFSNSISRSSKTMSECRALRSKKLKDGTNN